jgi:hypothetical protein
MSRSYISSPPSAFIAYSVTALAFLAFFILIFVSDLHKSLRNAELSFLLRLASYEQTSCSLQFKKHPNSSNVRTTAQITSETDPHPLPTCVLYSSNLNRHTRVKVTLVARPLLTPVAQKLCRREHGECTSRKCVNSHTLLRKEIVRYSS